MALLVAGAASAYDTPARGSLLRADLLDAVRIAAEADLGAPVEFVATELRHRGAVAFAILEPQRPGGAPIPWSDTAMAQAGDSQDFYDGLTIHAFLRAEGGFWALEDWSIGATDVWWSSAVGCDLFAAVIPEFCQ